MGMTSLERVGTDLAAMRQTIKKALVFVSDAATPEEVLDAINQTKLVREWAKINKLHAQVHVDLLRVEIQCLVKIATLGAVKQLPSAYRAAADFFGTMNPANLDAAITAHGSETTTLLAFHRALARNGVYEGEKKYWEGKSEQQWPVPDHATGDGYDDAEGIAEARQRWHNDSAAALITVVDMFFDDDQPFTVFEMADAVIEQVGFSPDVSWGMREGLHEICRRAIREAPDVLIYGTRAPRFVTCTTTGRDGVEQFVRVPFGAATLDQLQQMVDLRAEQADRAANVAAEMRMLAKQLRAHVLPFDKSPRLGDLVARIALSQEALIG
jgi:hypothetical protein